MEGDTRRDPGVAVMAVASCLPTSLPPPLSRAGNQNHQVSAFLQSFLSAWRGWREGELCAPHSCMCHHRVAHAWPQLDWLWSHFCPFYIVCPQGPGCSQCPLGTRENREDLWLWPGQRHHAWLELRVKRQCMYPLPSLELSLYLLHSLKSSVASCHTAHLFNVASVRFMNWHWRVSRKSPGSKGDWPRCEYQLHPGTRAAIWGKFLAHSMPGFAYL
jgi:hypothetical protein